MTLGNDWLCRHLVEDSRDAIIFADREGIIRLWNQGAEVMFGFPAADTLGRSLDIIIPENLRARHGEGYRRVMASGNTKYGQELLAVPALRRDGSRISVEFTIVLVRGEGGEVLGAGAIVREVTARWQREKAMRERVAALEAELDRVKQNSTPSQLGAGALPDSGSRSE
ncbi:MAG: PAS domain S-box protein [Deltaproteobacteria bacterium]|nr:PAS domain S-box protein [Deltaproteobacteria bacterium]